MKTLLLYLTIISVAFATDNGYVLKLWEFGSVPTGWQFIEDPSNIDVRVDCRGCVYDYATYGLKAGCDDRYMKGNIHKNSGPTLTLNSGHNTGPNVYTNAGGIDSYYIYFPRYHWVHCKFFDVDPLQTYYPLAETSFEINPIKINHHLVPVFEYFPEELSSNFKNARGHAIFHFETLGERQISAAEALLALKHRNRAGNFIPAAAPVSRRRLPSPFHFTPSSKPNPVFFVSIIGAYMDIDQEIKDNTFLYAKIQCGADFLETDIVSKRFRWQPQKKLFPTCNVNSKLFLELVEINGLFTEDSVVGRGEILATNFQFYRTGKAVKVSTNGGIRGGYERTTATVTVMIETGFPYDPELEWA